MMTKSHRLRTLIFLGSFCVIMQVCESAWAVVRLENICTIAGQKEQKLTGMGLVVGLNGTGDGGQNLPAIRALAAALKLMNNPVGSLEELENANNVAVVMLEVTIPPTGLSRGQKVDCYVSSFLGAKSLKGGRLLIAPLQAAEIKNDLLMGLVSGPIYLEDETMPTTGKVPRGAVLEYDFPSVFTQQRGQNSVTLLLNPAHASFTSASEISRVINQEFKYELDNQQVAKATAPGRIEVLIPRQYAETPVDFIAQLMEVGIENPHTQAKVVVNAKSGTVIVTGEVKISPVVITHRNLTVEVGGGAPVLPGVPTNPPFVAVPQADDPQAPVHLRELVEALNQLRVPTEDVISILRELNRTGKLHAVYEEY